jgi:hypothetical protein
LCFPRNHNSLLPIVIGVWDTANNIGTTSITYESNNAYEAPIEFNFNFFEDFNLFKKQIEEDVAYGMSEGAKICDMLKASDIESETTFLLSIYRNDKKEVMTVKCPSSPISISENKDDCIVTLFVQTGLKNEKVDTIYIDVGNDPTQKAAGHSASLGYYNWRWSLRNVDIINDNPLVLRCKLEDKKAKVCRMCRRI